MDSNTKSLNQSDLMIKSGATQNCIIMFFKKFINSVPIAISGLALGLAALGNLLKGETKVLGDYAGLVRNICGILSFVVLMILALKLLFDFKCAKEELKTSIPASVLSTSTMAIMLLCGYIRPHLPDISAAIWLSAVVTQICIAVYFFRHFVFSFKLNQVFPSWFIVFVGLVVASVTAPAFNMGWLGQIIFYVGFVEYFICLTLVVVRMIKIKHKYFALPARPTIAIFSAPMALLIVGYFNSFVNLGVSVNNKLLYFMLTIAAISYIFALVAMVFCLLKRFYPSYSSFTFPFVISALAFKLCANYISKLHNSLNFLTHISTVTTWIAAASVVFILICYVRYFIIWLKY